MSIDLRCYACGSPITLAPSETVLKQKTPMPWLVCTRCPRTFRLRELTEKQKKDR